MKRLFGLVIGLVVISGIFAQGNVVGKWKTIDDETGKMKSIVEITVKDGKLFGKIVSLTPESDPNKVCTACLDSRKGQKLVGMEIISGLVKDDGVYYGDDGILDPEKGSLYDCKIWEEGGKLQVRGYIGFFFRTQEWVRP